MQEMQLWAAENLGISAEVHTNHILQLGSNLLVDLLGKEQAATAIYQADIWKDCVYEPFGLAHDFVTSRMEPREDRKVVLELGNLRQLLSLPDTSVFYYQALVELTKFWLGVPIYEATYGKLENPEEVMLTNVLRMHLQFPYTSPPNNIHSFRA